MSTIKSYILYGGGVVVGDKIRFIHKELEELDTLDRAKVGIEFFCRNLAPRKFSDKELDSLAKYFSREVNELKEREGEGNVEVR